MRIPKLKSLRKLSVNTIRCIVSHAVLTVSLDAKAEIVSEWQT